MPAYQTTGLHNANIGAQLPEAHAAESPPPWIILRRRNTTRPVGLPINGAAHKDR